MKRLSIAVAAAISLAACQQSPNDENIAIDEVNNLAVNGDVETLPASESGGAPVDLNSGSDASHTANVTENASAEESAKALIPAQYRGRWGMVAADCTSTRGDAKGLITVNDATIRFYESTATLKEQRPAIATSFSGLFGFTGEGQTWEKVMTFTRSADTLTRAEDEGNFTYKRC
jgi:hypothetical protein